ncbi:MAG: hypothetical protein M1815_001222 [Lichina confinis]|nr:MAG: hypothetical protein M1815_001222 [Lichina confinis]
MTYVTNDGAVVGRKRVPDYVIEPDVGLRAPPTRSADSSTVDINDGSSTQSLSQSELNLFPTENGRRYHRYREGSYHYPNDEVEMERLDMQYEIMRTVMGGRELFAPLKDPKKILDIGTGTGTWPIAIDEACEVDMELTSLPTMAGVPDNVHFLLDDAAEEDWLYPLESFDFIHTRTMLGSFEDFRDIIKRSLKYTKPGGWMESQEWMPRLYCDDGTMPPDWPWAEWHSTMDQAAMRLGKPLRIANRLKKWYKEAGFVDVHEEVFKVPSNPWPKDPHLKDLGRLTEAAFLEGVQGLSMGVFHRGLGWSRNEIELYLVNVRNAIRDRSVHAYYKM